MAIKIFKGEEQILWPCKLSNDLKVKLSKSVEVIDAEPSQDLTGLASLGVLHVVQGIVIPCMLTKSVRTVTGVVLGKGVWFGNANLSNIINPHLEFEVIEPAKILLFPVEASKKIAEQNEQIYKWLWCVHQGISSRWLQAQVISGESIIARLAYLLLDIAAQLGSTLVSTYPINASQYQISTMSGISRSRVNEALKDLERQGNISINRSSITIVNIKGLSTHLEEIDLSYHDPRKIINTNSLECNALT